MKKVSNGYKRIIKTGAKIRGGRIYFDCYSKFQLFQRWRVYLLVVVIEEFRKKKKKKEQFDNFIRW